MNWKKMNNSFYSDSDSAFRFISSLMKQFWGGFYWGYDPKVVDDMPHNQTERVYKPQHVLDQGF